MVGSGALGRVGGVEFEFFGGGWYGMRGGRWFAEVCLAGVGLGFEDIRVFWVGGGAVGGRAGREPPDNPDASVGFI